jgi:hypothetical protein
VCLFVGCDRGGREVRIVSCKRALSNLMFLSRSVILDVDYLHLWTLEVMEGVMI